MKVVKIVDWPFFRVNQTFAHNEFRGRLTYFLFLALVFEVFCKEANWQAITNN